MNTQAENTLKSKRLIPRLCSIIPRSRYFIMNKFLPIRYKLLCKKSKYKKKIVKKIAAKLPRSIINECGSIIFLQAIMRHKEEDDHYTKISMLDALTKFR